jgi:hypothetical protein
VLWMLFDFQQVPRALPVRIHRESLHQPATRVPQRSPVTVQASKLAVLKHSRAVVCEQNWWPATLAGTRTTPDLTGNCAYSQTNRTVRSTELTAEQTAVWVCAANSMVWTVVIGTPDCAEFTGVSENRPR